MSSASSGATMPSRAISVDSSSTSDSGILARILALSSLPSRTSSTAALRRPLISLVFVLIGSPHPPGSRSAAALGEPAAQELGDLVGLVLDHLADLPLA